MHGDDQTDSPDTVRESDSEPRIDSRQDVVRSLLRGGIGGLVGAVTMTVYRLPLFEGLPPTAEFWATFVGGGDPEEYRLQALVLHLFYGSAAGGVLGFLVFRRWKRRVDHHPMWTILIGIVYSGVLEVFGSRVLLGRLLGIQMERREKLVFVVGHMMYGLTLGTWVATEGTIGRSDDDESSTDQRKPDARG